ncbi:MAG: ATP-dependent RNA/DNA helicase IGHMBP2 [Kiritimatiellia bacterium]|jgi:ATP-dependent RNA/DNA helicase IGHMBP2
MPLHIDSLPSRITKGALLRWMLDTEVVRKQQVGSIEIYGRHASIEIPDSVGPRLAKRLDGQQLNGRTTQVWFEAPDEDNDPTGHFDQLTRWLDMERTAEADQAAAWQKAGGDHDSSTSLLNLVIRSEDTGLGGYAMITLGRNSLMQPLPATRLTVGAPVRLAEQGHQAGPPQRGLVTRLEKNSIEVALGKPPAAETDTPTFRIDAADDETVMLRSRAALARARHANEDRLSELRDVCLGLREPLFDEFPTLTFQDPNLNDSQRAAVTFACAAQDIAIIHGPPGTGKTRTLVEIIRQAVTLKQKVLVCAPSNLGVDNLLERLLDRGTKVVRIGHIARVLPRLRAQCLSELVPKHRDVRNVKKLRLEAAELFRKADKASRGLDRNVRQALRQEAGELLADARVMEVDIAQEIIDQAEVVCATNTGITSDLLEARRFDLVVIDEACQCSEPSCWIPLSRAERMILAGDHCQLPPTVISQAAAEEGFAISMQERLVKVYGARVCKPLLIQYRMHEEIMRYSSAQFYENTLQADDSVARHLLCELPDVREDELTDCAVRFIDTSGSSFEEEREAAGSSLANPQEAALAVKKAMDLIALGVSPEDIAIITPYTAQVRALRECMTNDAVEIGSIDGFQGREKEVVIISLVRSNSNKEIGFLRDTRRMNVALTRARRKLIVIGDSATIADHPFYSGLLEHFDAIDAYHGVWDE